LATLAQAISRTIAATPVTQSAVRASSPGSGPALVLIAPTTARGFAISGGAVPGSPARSASQLCRYAWLASADALSIETPGLRRTIIDIHPQLYCV
jgi:hypothetical protein